MRVTRTSLPSASVTLSARCSYRPNGQPEESSSSGTETGESSNCFGRVCSPLSFGHSHKRSSFTSSRILRTWVRPLERRRNQRLARDTAARNAAVPEQTLRRNARKDHRTPASLRHSGINPFPDLGNHRLRLTARTRHPRPLHLRDHITSLRRAFLLYARCRPVACQAVAADGTDRIPAALASLRVRLLAHLFVYYVF